MSRVILCLVSVLMFASSTVVAQEDEETLIGLNYWNKLKAEVITTDSGLQYKVLIMGRGKKPGPSAKVEVHYRGLLLNGVTFDSSYDDDEPIKLKLAQMIKGWIEGIQLMPKGSVFVFMIPPELAYGESRSGNIPGNSTLLFEVELFGF